MEKYQYKIFHITRKNKILSWLLKRLPLQEASPINCNEMDETLDTFHIKTFRQRAFKRHWSEGGTLL